MLLGDVARAHLAGYSSLPHLGDVPQLHGDWGDTEFITHLVLGAAADGSTAGGCAFMCALSR